MYGQLFTSAVVAFAFKVHGILNHSFRSQSPGSECWWKALAHLGCLSCLSCLWSTLRSEWALAESLQLFIARRFSALPKQHLFLLVKQLEDHHKDVDCDSACCNRTI